jgi:hypothetical protein
VLIVLFARGGILGGIDKVAQRLKPARKEEA